MSTINRVIKGGFFDSVNGDRKYSADEMNRPYKRVITEGVFATPQGTPSTDFQVLSANDGMKIVVKKGEGLVGGRWAVSEDDLFITVPANGGTTARYDSIFLRADNMLSAREISIQYRTGDTNVPPKEENLRVKEYRIANIYVAAGATYISQSSIVDLRGSLECPWITSLIKQVDTSALFAQYQDAYKEYFDTTKAEFKAWAESVADELSPYITIANFASSFTTIEPETTTILINIPSYDKSKDILNVFVNGLRLAQNVDYTVSGDGTSITLTKALYANAKVDFQVLQSTAVISPEDTIEKLQQLDAKISPLLSDSGWVDLTLESGAEAFDSSSTPAVRRYGNNVYIRGEIKGLNTAPATICTLPADMRPAMNHQYTTAAILGSLFVSCMLEIKTTGQITLIAKSGTIPADATLPISTNFIVG